MRVVQYLKAGKDCPESLAGNLALMNEEMNPHSKPVMRMVICPLNGWHPLSACNICEHHLCIHTNVDTSDSEVSCGYIAANGKENEVRE